MQNEQCLVNGSKEMVQHKQKNEYYAFVILSKNGDIKELKAKNKENVNLICK